MPIPPHENLIVGACAIACVLLVATGLFAYQAPADHDYSGRGMFGRKCPAIVTDQVFYTLAQLVEAIAWALEGREDFTVAEVFRWSSTRRTT